MSNHSRDKFKAYIIENHANGKKYVGITTRPIEARYWQHLKAAKDGAKLKLSRAIRKHGPQSFSITHVASANSRENLMLLEQQLVAQEASFKNGYNMTIGGESNSHGEAITVAGVEYLHIPDAAEQLGVNHVAARARLVRGWTPEQAFEIEPRPERPSVNGKEVQIQGKTFPSMQKACNHFGVTHSAYQKRRTMGWTLNQALGIEAPPDPRIITGQSIELNGKQYISIAQACRDLGKAYNRIRDRLEKGWPLEEAFEFKARTKPLPSRAVPVTVAGVSFTSRAAAAIHYGIDPRLVHTRMTRGKLTLEQALGIDELPKRPKLVPKNAKSIIVNGQEFSSLAAACRFHKLVLGTVNDRIKSGWSIKQAFGLEPPPIKPPRETLNKPPVKCR